MLAIPEHTEGALGVLFCHGVRTSKLGEQPGAREVARRRLDNGRRGEEVEDLRPGRRYIHRSCPGKEHDLLTRQV